MNKIRFSILTLSVVVASMFFSGCGEDKGEANLSSVPAVVEGTWQDDCNDYTSESSRALIEFQDGIITQTTSIYLNDNTCTTVDQLEYVAINVVYGSEKTTPNGDNVYDIDFRITSLRITPKTASGVDDLNNDNNATGFCGHTDWQIDVEKVLTDNCSGVNTDIFLSFENTYYDILGVLDSDNKLYFGDTSGDYNGTSVDTRPIELGTSSLTKLP